jgi:hypothetical protein
MVHVIMNNAINDLALDGGRLAPMAVELVSPLTEW